MAKLPQELDRLLGVWSGDVRACFSNWEYREFIDSDGGCQAATDRSARRVAALLASPECRFRPLFAEETAPSTMVAALLAAYHRYAAAVELRRVAHALRDAIEAGDGDAEEYIVGGAMDFFGYFGTDRYKGVLWVIFEDPGGYLENIG